MTAHSIVTADSRPREKATARNDRAYLMCSCGSFLEPIVPRSAVLRCKDSGVIAGSVVWREQAGTVSVPIVSGPKGLGQRELDL